MLFWLMNLGFAGGGSAPAADTFFENKNQIEDGMKTVTAAGMGGVLVE